jgi:hypothetical protein
MANNEWKSALDVAPLHCDNSHTMNARDRPEPISDLLRRTIERSKVPYLTIEQATGVARASIMRFVLRKQSLRLDMADRLAAYFGLELRGGKEGLT